MKHPETTWRKASLPSNQEASLIKLAQVLLWALCLILSPILWASQVTVSSAPWQACKPLQPVNNKPCWESPSLLTAWFFTLKISLTMKILVLNTDTEAQLKLIGSLPLKTAALTIVHTCSSRLEPPWRLSEKATLSKRLLSTTALSIWIDRRSDQTLSSKWAHRWTKEDLPWMITLTSLATWALIAGLNKSSISSQWQRETRT